MEGEGMMWLVFGKEGVVCRAWKNVRWNAFVEVPSQRAWWHTKVAVKRWVFSGSVWIRSLQCGDGAEKPVLFSMFSRSSNSASLSSPSGKLLLRSWNETGPSRSISGRRAKYGALVPSSKGIAERIGCWPISDSHAR